MWDFSEEPACRGGEVGGSAPVTHFVRELNPFGVSVLWFFLWTNKERTRRTYGGAKEPIRQSAESSAQPKNKKMK
jgi:hypothetical protein